ncbi:MAG: hypothetical protein V4596_05420 [Bdellovibrionota bacterium]
MKLLIFFTLLISVNLKANECSSLFFENSRVSKEDIVHNLKIAEKDFDKAAEMLKLGGVDWAPLSAELVNKVESLINEYHQKTKVSPKLPISEIASSIKRAFKISEEIEQILIREGILSPSSRNNSNNVQNLLTTKQQHEQREKDFPSTYDFTQFTIEQKLNILRMYNSESRSLEQIVKNLAEANRQIKFLKLILKENFPE